MFACSRVACHAQVCGVLPDKPAPRADPHVMRRTHEIDTQGIWDRGAPAHVAPTASGSASASSITHWHNLQVFPDRAAPASSPLAAEIPSAAATAAAASSPSAGPAAGRAGKLTSRTAATVRRKTDQPVTFHRKISSSSYGSTYGKQKLGHAPSKPRQSCSVAMSNGVSRLLAQQRMYPVPGPPPEQLETCAQVHAAGISGLAYSPDGKTLAACSRDGRAVVLSVAHFSHRCNSCLLVSCQHPMPELARTLILTEACFS